MTLTSDFRWIGPHGIGRFAAELLSRLPHQVFPIHGQPMSPIDSLRLTRAVGRLPRNSIFFSPGYNAPLYARCRTVLTLHDLNHIDTPYNKTWLKTLYYETVLREACRRASFVFTVSEYSRARIASWSNIGAARIVNIGNGVGAEFHPGVGHRHGGRPYFLAVGNRKPHKNEERLLTAFAASNAGREADLVFTGSASKTLADLTCALGVSQRIHYSGQVPNDVLANMYRGATAVLFPSLYEGFGLPVIESMACGTPVLTSTTTALPEVAADAALLVDPTSIDDIAGGIDRLWNDAALRDALRSKGLERARSFNWDDVARRARAAFDSLSNDCRPTASELHVAP